MSLLSYLLTLTLMRKSTKRDTKLEENSTTCTLLLTLVDFMFKRDEAKH